MAGRSGAGVDYFIAPEGSLLGSAAGMSSDVQPISLPGYGSTLETNADGTPYLLDGDNVSDLSPVTVTASEADQLAAGLDTSLTLPDLVPGTLPAITLDNVGATTDDSASLPSSAWSYPGSDSAVNQLRMQEMDVMPGSAKDKQLLAQIALAGSLSGSVQDQLQAQQAQWQLTTTGGMSRTGEQASASSVPFDTSLYVAPDSIATTYNDATSTLFDSDASFGDRLASGVVSIVGAPVAFLDMVGNGIENVPYQASIMGQSLAAASQASNTDDKVLDYLQAVQSGATAFTSAGAVADPVAGLAPSDSLLGAELGVGRSGITLTTPGTIYTVRSPLYLDSPLGQLNSGIPLNVRSPLVNLTEDVSGVPDIEVAPTSLGGPNPAASLELSQDNILASVSVSEATAARASTGPIQAGEITTFQDFVDRSVVGDGIEGHELWQHANLRANGLTTTRLSTEASQGNPVIALERSTHQQVNAVQRLFDASAQTPLENINANAQILRDLNIAPEADILRLQQMAIEHAQKYGY